jgi:hypothetical protein
MASFCSGKSGRDCVVVAHFTKKDDVWILAKCAPQSVWPAFGIASELALTDYAFTPRKYIFDRILNRDNMFVLGLIYFLYQSCKRGRFALSGRTSKQYETLFVFCK